MFWKNDENNGIMCYLSDIGSKMLNLVIWLRIISCDVSFCLPQRFVVFSCQRDVANFGISVIIQFVQRQKVVLLMYITPEYINFWYWFLLYISLQNIFVFYKFISSDFMYFIYWNIIQSEWNISLNIV